MFPFGFVQHGGNAMHYLDILGCGKNKFSSSSWALPRKQEYLDINVYNFIQTTELGEGKMYTQHAEQTKQSLYLPCETAHLCTCHSGARSTGLQYTHTHTQHYTQIRDESKPLLPLFNILVRLSNDNDADSYLLA